MLNFLSRFRRGADHAAQEETLRQTFERLVTELNAAIDGLPEKPRVSIEPATGHVAFDLPEQFPDEALALPSPEKADTVPTEDADEVQPEDEKAAA